MTKLILTLVAAFVMSVLAPTIIITKYYENGNKSVEYTQKDVITKYYENGNKSVEYTQKDGKRDGSDRFYNQDGTIRYVYNYKAGVLDGVALFYYDSGALYTKTIYIDGMFVEKIVYNEDGSIAYVSKLQKGKCVEVDSNNRVIYSQIQSLDKYCK